MLAAVSKCKVCVGAVGTTATLLSRYCALVPVATLRVWPWRREGHLPHP